MTYADRHHHHHHPDPPPPPKRDAFVRFHVIDTKTDAPLGDVLLSSTGGPGPWQTMTNGCGDAWPTLSPASYSITFSKAGYADRVLAADIENCGEIVVGLDRTAPVIPPTVMRPPLGPFDPDTTDPDTGAPLPVCTTMQQTPPPRWTLRWWRNDSWGVTFPDLPAVPGGADGGGQTRVLSWFLDRYVRAGGIGWEDKILQRNLQYGYDRFVLSPPDSIKGCGMSIADYTAMAVRVKQAGLEPCHMLLSKVYDGENPDPHSLDPLLDSLLAADVINLAAVAWEANLFMSPEHFQTVIDYVASRLPISATRALYAHFSPHYASWQPDRPGGSGADFWPLQVGKLTGLLYQCDPNWSVGMMQARINDVLSRLIQGGLWGLPQTFDCVVWETIATLQFYDDADQDRGEMVGYETLCSVGPMPVMGYGNGCRCPDGSPM